MFLKRVVRCNGIPFELRAAPFYSAENQSRLLAAKECMERTGGTVYELIEVDDDMLVCGLSCEKLCNHFLGR